MMVILSCNADVQMRDFFKKSRILEYLTDAITHYFRLVQEDIGNRPLVDALLRLAKIDDDSQPELV